MLAKLAKQVRPVYPPGAKQNRIEGTVVLACVIGTDGKLSKVSFVSGPLALYEESRRAVSQWEYKPYLVDDQPVEVLSEIEVNYRLR
jgi:protein TonB